MAQHASGPAGYTHSEAFDAGFLAVGSVHKIWYGQYGNPSGRSVIFLHGGPGAGTSMGNTAYFDPAVYRVVLLDQRGAGKSTPANDIRENTTHDLINDIETLRKHLGIDQWSMVFGGSWGSTLAVLYAQTHPEATGSLVVRGVSLGRESEVANCYTPYGLWNQLFPDIQEEYIEYLRNVLEKEGKLHSVDLTDPYQIKKEYYRILWSEDTSISIPASKAWNKHLVPASTLPPNPSQHDKDEHDDLWNLQHARFECHYFLNDAWLEDGSMLRKENLNKIKHIPCHIVQGRYDLICPIKTAWELHRALPNSTLHIIPDAGHKATASPQKPVRDHDHIC